MNQISVSIPDSLQQFVEAQVSAGAHKSASEYLEKLIREARDEHAQIEKRLLEALNSGPAIPFSPTEFDELLSEADRRENIRD